MLKGKIRQHTPVRGWTDLSDLRSKHNGEKCFVVGAGPSIGFLNLEPIQRHVVISVNSSALLMNWSSGDPSKRYWISNDRLCLRWDYFWTHVLRAKCNKIVRTSWKKYDDQIKDHGFRYFAPRKHESSVFYPDDGGLCSVSSIPTAIDLALLMGCAKIYLLGVDQRMLHGNSHFWQFWDRKKWPKRNDKGKNFRPEQKHQKKVFDQNVEVFDALKKYANSKGSIIKNCSSVSSLKVFEQISLADALGEQ